MAIDKDPATMNVFSTDHPLRGTYFTFAGALTSGLFRDLEKLAEWTYYHFDSGRYVLRAWERDTLIDNGDERYAPEELRNKVFTAEVYPQPQHREINFYSSVFMLEDGRLSHFGCFQERQQLIELVQPHPGLWLIARAAAIVDMW